MSLNVPLRGSGYPHMFRRLLFIFRVDCGGLSPYFSSCLKREVGRGRGAGGGGRGAGGGGREGGSSLYFNSCFIRVLAAKHFPCSSPTPIHITPVLLHP